MSVNKILVNNLDSNYTHSIFDISEYTGQQYSTLSDALNAIPQAKQKGGMTIRYVQTNDNKYVQYRLVSDTFNTTPFNWQGVDEIPMSKSHNLVTSSGVLSSMNNIIPSFQYGYLIRSIKSSVKLQSLKFKSFINRSSNPSQLLSFRAVKENGENVDLIYQVSNGTTKSTTEIIPITNNGITLSVIVCWGGSESVYAGNNYDVDLNFVNQPYKETIVENNLTSTSASNALSANQGRILDGKITDLSADVQEEIEGILSDTEEESRPAFTILGYGVTDTGVIGSVGYNATDFIDISDATKIVLKNLYANQYGIRGYIFYAEDKSTILAKNDPVSSVSYIPDVTFENDIPEGAKWLRCSEHYIAQLPEYKRGEIIITIKKDGIETRLTNVEHDIEELKEKDSTLLSRKINDDDILETDGNHFYLDGNDVMKGGSKYQDVGFIAFKENVKAIQFELGDSSKNNNLISILCGVGVDANDVNVFARIDLPTYNSGTQYGVLKSVACSSSESTTPDTASLTGSDSYSSPLRMPFNNVYKPKTGDICKIEIYNNTFMEGSVLVDGVWVKWFSVYQLGSYYNKSLPVRSGWNDKFVLGFAVASDSGYCLQGNVAIARNIEIINDTNSQSISRFYKCEKKWTNRKTWLAIGDSITALNGIAGLGYIGFAERKYNLISINKGMGGWTAYRYWRDRNGWYTTGDGHITTDTSGTFHEGNHWQEVVASLPKNSIVSICLGTNDFSTNFAIPPSDEVMDTYPDPHPRFGTLDPNDADYKNSHTTLGCLRLIIERIMELSPTAKIVILAPLYRTQGVVDYTHDVITEMLINSEGRTIYDYADAITQVGQEYNLPSYNVCRSEGVNYNNIEAFTYDNLHTNEDGGCLLGDYVGDKLLS